VVQLSIQSFVLVNSQGIYLSLSLFFSNYGVQLILFSSDACLNRSYLSLKLLASSDLVVQICRIHSSFSLIFFRLSKNIVVRNFIFVDLIVEGPQLILSSLGLLVLQLQFCNQLVMIVFSLVQSLIQFCINRLVISHKSLQVF